MNDHTHTPEVSELPSGDPVHDAFVQIQRWTVEAIHRQPVDRGDVLTQIQRWVIEGQRRLDEVEGGAS